MYGPMYMKLRIKSNEKDAIVFQFQAVFRHLLGDQEENQQNLNQCNRLLGRYLKPAISSKLLYLPKSHWCDWVTNTASSLESKVIKSNLHLSITVNYNLLLPIIIDYNTVETADDKPKSNGTVE
jgi:hypothetical protein